jgi:hypothetical protein
MIAKNAAHQPHALELPAKLRALGIDVAAMSRTVPAPLVFRLFPFGNFK